jgi:hypothetical protein
MYAAVAHQVEQQTENLCVAGSSPARGTINRRNKMKPVTLKNILNGERFICEDLRQTEVIDGVEFITVHRPNELRTFKIRRDILVKDTTVVKGKSRNFAKV